MHFLIDSKIREGTDGRSDTSLHDRIIERKRMVKEDDRYFQWYERWDFNS